MKMRRPATLLFSLILCVSLSASALAAEFPDVSPEHWAHDDIVKAADYGLVQGLEDGSFRPDEIMNRASFVSILQRMFQWEAVSPAAPSFTDCAPGDWFYSAVETAKANGVLEDGDAFVPMGYLTREDMAVMLVRALGYETLADGIGGLERPFPDVTTHPGHIALARDFGMTNGVDVEGKLLFQPDSFATRGQVAAMLVRVNERYTSKIDWLHAFYAFSSFSQIDFTAKMDGVSVGWARMSYSPETGSWLNSTSANGNDWIKPQDTTPATSYFQGNSTPYNLNVFADTSKNVDLPDGTKTSVVAQVLGNAEVRTAAVAALAAAVPDYAGITIDFEGMKGEDLKAPLVAFMTELRAALPQDKTLYICVQPDRWYKGFDYRGLGEVCDKVILMAHDYQWTSVDPSYLGSVMGSSKNTSSPVTPFPDIYEALNHITDPETGVQDKSKIALAISFGTACFQIDGEGKLVDTTINHPAQTTIATRLSQPDSVISYDPVYRNPTVTYTSEEGKRYLMWYEDSRSVMDKIALARMFGINGVSLWRLGTIPNYPDNPAVFYDVWGAIQNAR